MQASEIINLLSPFITERRLDLMKNVLSQRSKYMTIVLEDIFQPHNASAVLRTADCLGLQDIYIIENRNKYKVNPDVALGSANWLNLNKINSFENNSIETVKILKQKGYRIVATTPHKEDKNLEDFNIENGPFALVFGNEKDGISPSIIELADEFLKIPMYGFTESFNISVCAGICMHHLSLKLRNSELNYCLTQEEQNNVLASWLTYSINNADKILAEYENRKQEKP